MTLKSFRNQMPTLGENVYIDDSAIVIGAVVLGDDVSIWPTAVVRGDVEKITIGNNTNVQDGAVNMGNCAAELRIPNLQITTLCSKSLAVMCLIFEKIANFKNFLLHIRG